MNRVFSTLIAILFSTLILFTSCGTKYAAEIVKVDTLMAMLNKAQNELKAIDTVDVNRKYEEVKGNITSIQKNYTDTLTREMAEFLGEYNGVLMVFETVKQRYPELEKELTYSGEQLKNFKHDLQYNIVNEEKVKEHYKREEQALKGNVESIQIMIDALKNNNELYAKLTPQVKQLMESMNTKQNKN